MSDARKFSKWRNAAEAMMGRPDKYWSYLECMATPTEETSFVWDELQRIARATELDSVEIATPDRLNALRDRVREILEGE